jgi:hypothetical protein
MPDFSIKTGGADWDNTLFAPTIGSNGTFDVAVSDDIQNNNNDTAVRVIVEYEELTPDGTVNNIGPTYELAVVVEGRSATGRYYVIGFQRDSINDRGDGPQHEIIIQPGYSGFDGDETVQIGDQQVGKIARHDGKVPDPFRVRVRVSERDHTSAGQFVSCRLTGYGELFTP